MLSLPIKCSAPVTNTHTWRHERHDTRGVLSARRPCGNVMMPFCERSFINLFYTAHAPVRSRRFTHRHADIFNFCLAHCGVWRVISSAVQHTWDTCCETSAVSEKRPRSEEDSMSKPASFLFFGGSSPWVYALADALARIGNLTKIIAPYDLLTYCRLRPNWPSREIPPCLYREQWIMPPGYTGRFANIFTPLLRLKVARATTWLGLGMSEHPWIITPYPWFGPALEAIPGERIIYLNYDNYQLFRPDRAVKILQQERHLIGRARLTLCSSMRQMESLRMLCPEKAAFIRHFPHGVVEEFLNTKLEQAVEVSTVGYVGNLTDRVDWRFVTEVASALPAVRFIFVGRFDSPEGSNQRCWQQQRAVALALDNVCHVGQVAQDEVAKYYCGFDINWIPYTVDHVFNQAASPTKIMDGMASGRPILSTDLPEPRLYPEWIKIVHSAEEAAAEISEILMNPRNLKRAYLQLQFARQQTWVARAEQLAHWLLAEGEVI